MKLPGKVSIPSEVVSQTLGAEVVLLHLGTGVYWSLNTSGAVIWNAVQAYGSVPQAVTALCDEFEISEVKAQDAVATLLRELVKEGLVEIAP